MMTKRITAWILFAAMFMTLLPSSVVFASAPTNNCPELTVALYTQDSSKDLGDDLLKNGENLYTVGAGGKFDGSAADDGADIWHNADMWPVDKEGNLFPTGRRLAVSIKAKSETANGFGTNHTLASDDTVEFAYLNMDKEYIPNADNKIWTQYNKLPQYRQSIDEFNKEPEEISLAITAAANQQLVENDALEVVIWNIVNKEFAGYLRIKVKDITGKTTIQDVLIIADGKDPVIEVSSVTEKNKVGETNTETYDVQIDGRKFGSKVEGNEYEVNSDWKDNTSAKTDDEIRGEIKKMVEGTDGYVAHDYWATGDIRLSIKATDWDMSSELKNLQWNVYNYPNADLNTFSLRPVGGTKPIVNGEIVLATYLDDKKQVDNVPDASTSDKKAINADDYIGDSVNNLTDEIAEDDLIIPASAQGLNILEVVAKDVMGYTSTSYYYYFIDSTAPDANYELVKLDEQVMQLFSNADTVTKCQQGIDMTASEDVENGAKLISNIDTTDEDVFQYRLLARDYAVAETDIDLNAVDANGVPVGYTSVAPADTNLTYGTWLDWSLDSSVAVIDEEFDGLIQVRVQDKAGNWSAITEDEEGSVIADNTDGVLNFDAFEVKADDSFDITKSILESGANVIENRETKWVKESALLWAQISDEDLANDIRSSGLWDGEIKIEVAFDTENEGKKATIYGFDEYQNRDKAKDFTFTDTKGEIILNSSNYKDYCFEGNGDIDKFLGFMIQYDGTGVADVTVTITDKAENVNDYSDDFKYNVRLKVDKINPIVTFKSYDESDTDKKDLLVSNSGADVDYEVRNMPWGPNSQILEVNVVDNDKTPVQSGLINGTIKIKADKPLVIKNQNGGSDLSVSANTEATISAKGDYAVENIENLDYTFYAVYEGTGIAKIEVYAEDEAENVRDYPSVATRTDELDPASATVTYDAMLRVDTINPEIKNVQLVETDADVEDKGWTLFTFDETNVDVNTRKQMKLTFEIVDETETTEQSGVNIQNEYLDTDLTDVYGKYVENDKIHLYDNEATSYVTDDINDISSDPHIDYILLPEEAGSINGTGGKFEKAVSTSSDDIEALVAKYIGTQYNDSGYKCEWKKAEWKDGGIVVPVEFQGAIVIRTIDRVGNIDYYEPITFVAESKAPMIDFLRQEGYVYSQNNYGWSKRPYDYVEIRVKDDNEGNVDAWLENVFINVEDLEGNDISAKDTVKFAHKIHADDKNVEVNPTAYDYVSLTEFTNEIDYGYDVIDDDGLVESLARDKDGYIHLGYVRVSESAKINVTVFDKAKYNNGDYTGNKLTATWTARIDRTAPVIDIFELEKCDDDSFALLLRASDDESGLAPMWGESDFLDVYNKYHKAGDSFLYEWEDHSDGNADIYDRYTDEKGIINPGQYELPGLQYALLEEGDTIEDIEPWQFEVDPNGLADNKTAFSSNGYYRNEFEKTKVWHNYNSAITPVVTNDFDGYIVVRAIDRAGNITVMGYAPTLDVTADDAWKRDTQYINVKALDIAGDDVSKVEYYGNNGLLYPESAKRDITAEALSGEGAFIEVVEEGITKVIVKAYKNYGEEVAVTLGESGERNDIWEGNLILGNPTTAGYEDWKYQIADVKIDKTAPTFDMTAPAGATSQDMELTVSNITDPIPNESVEGMSHIPSGIAKVEWCKIDQGFEATNDVEDWEEVKPVDGSVTLIVKAYNDKAFKGTVKVRVTDRAGNVTEKGHEVRVDGTSPIISISKSYSSVCSHEPVEVKVTVTPSVEFSDIKNVKYELTGAQTGSDDLTLSGGTISIDKEGTTHVKVTATNNADVTAVCETDVTIHYDLAMPTLNGITSGAWKIDNNIVEIVADSTDKVRYSTNASKWIEDLSAGKTIELVDGENTIRIQSYRDCGCKSDVNTYVVYYDSGIKPEIDVTYDNTWKKDSAVVTISAKRGNTSKVNIESIKYDLSNEYGGSKTGYLAGNGGNIVIQQEGIWLVNNVIVTMESGKQYKLGMNTEPDKSFTELNEYDGTDDGDSYVGVSMIDRTAPTVEEGAYSLEEGGNDAFYLFGSDGYTGKKTLRLSTDVNKIKDAPSNTNAYLTYEYAVVKKGETVANWTKYTPKKANFVGDTLTNETELPLIIDSAFEGSILLKVTDFAGNETVVSKTVFTEGDKPEISITAPSDWQTENFMVNVSVSDKGLSSGIKTVCYKLFAKGTTVTEDSFTGTGIVPLTSMGGSVEITTEGEYVLGVRAEDYAGNIHTASTTVKLDKTAPEYSGIIELLGVYNAHKEIPESDWDVIHDGWTYNHDVSLEGIKDIYSGIKKVHVKFTDDDGDTTETTLNSHQTSSSFSEDGKYELTLLDNAGNVRNINFVINKKLNNVINIIGIDELGKLRIAVTDGDDMLTFYKKENSESKYTRMHNGITDSITEGKTGVRYIYGQNDSGKKTNTLYVIVAPSTEYGISLMSLDPAPNRYLNIDAEGGNVKVKKIDEIFNPGINKDITVGSMIEINEDGVYKITTNN